MPTPDNTKMLTPDGLTNQLFDGALKQNPTDARLAARQVISFLMNALMYALTSSKNDPIVFLTEALVDVIGASSEDDTARKEVLKHISDILAAAALQAPPAQGQPTAAQQAINGQPSNNKPAGKP